jgi:hypothetical protein
MGFAHGRASCTNSGVSGLDLGEVRRDLFDGDDFTEIPPWFSDDAGCRGDDDDLDDGHFSHRL